MVKNKQKVLNVILTAVFIWLVVSIYFYGQHLIVIKEYPVYAKAETEDAILMVKNVVAYNHTRNYNYDPFSQEPPWYVKVGKRIDNPRLQHAFFSICSFYSRPYIFDPDKRTVKLQGMIIFKNIDRYQDVSLHDDNPFSVQLYGDFDTSLTSGTDGYHAGDSNIIYFEAHGDEVLLNNNHTFKAVIKDSQTGELIKELPFNPQWQYGVYNFWQRKPDNYSFAPTYTVDRFINLVKQENHVAAASYLHHKSKDVFPWSNLDREQLALKYMMREYYVGEYLGIKDVFAVDILFIEPDRMSYSRGDEFARQTIYFTHNFGQWKIIDATPWREIS